MAIFKGQQNSSKNTKQKTRVVSNKAKPWGSGGFITYAISRQMFTNYHWENKKVMFVLKSFLEKNLWWWIHRGIVSWVFKMGTRDERFSSMENHHHSPLHWWKLTHEISVIQEITELLCSSFMKILTEKTSWRKNRGNEMSSTLLSLFLSLSNGTSLSICCVLLPNLGLSDINIQLDHPSV